MKILTLKQRLRFIIVAFIILIFAIFFGIVFPTTSGILSLQQEIKVTEVFLETQYQKSRRLETKDQDLDSIASSLDSFSILTVSTESELSLIQTFEDLAENNNVIQQLSVSFVASPDKITNLPYYEFTFLNHGRYQDHIRYLHALGALPYIVDIDRLEMKGNVSTNDSNSSVSMKFSVRIYAKEK